jgi:hypothetical protein
LSPAFMRRLSRIALGIVVWPLLVSVASVLMACSVILTKVILARSRQQSVRPHFGVVFFGKGRF